MNLFETSPVMVIRALKIDEPFEYDPAPQTKVLTDATLIGQPCIMVGALFSSYPCLYTHLADVIMLEDGRQFTVKPDQIGPRQ